VHLYKIFAACRNIALTVSVKVRIGTPKNGSFVRTKSPTGSKFSKISFSAVVCRMDCSCAPMLQFFAVVSDGATTERQI